MAVTIPFVCFGIGRYLLLVRRRVPARSLKKCLPRDPPLLAAIAAWVVVCAAILRRDLRKRAVG